MCLQERKGGMRECSIYIRKVKTEEGKKMKKIINEMKKTKIFFLKYLLILFCITIIFQSNSDLSSMIKVYDNDYEEILAIEECDDYVCALYKTNDSHVKLMIFKNNSYF